MSCILNIETSTDVCSVAVSNAGECIFNKEAHDGPNHAVSLGVFVDEALSFKGVCYGRAVKLVAVPTLELLCVPVLLQELVKETGDLLCPMLDARRMEVYAKVVDRSLNEIRPIQADVVDGETYREYLAKGPVYFFGNGAEKCMETINNANARLISGIEPLAKNMFPLAEKRLANGQSEDVAYFVPFYLKDFVAKKAKELLH